MLHSMLVVVAVRLAHKACAVLLVVAPLTGACTRVSASCSPGQVLQRMMSRKRRMQALSGMGTADAHEETIVLTLRLKETANEEARMQAATFVRLLFETWEPPQAVRVACI